MSAKWRRSQAWDQQHLTGALAPARVVLGGFSSIRLSIVLLVLVAAYAVLASVPIGLLALAPTWVLYALSLVLTLVLLAGVPAGVIRATLLSRAGRGVRFAVPLLLFLALGAVAAWVWRSFLWPAMAFNPADGSGFRIAPGFVDAYRSTTLRRLPGFEMTELEFYSWWPLRVVLLLFCVNLIVATVRRIEFSIKTLGVLTVHTGIITIALGSIFYQRFKQEGDTILLASGTPGQPGPAAAGFYDNQRLALFVLQRPGEFGAQWEQRLLDSVPRYNDYALRARAGGGSDSLWGLLGLPDPAAGVAARELDLPVPDGEGQFVDPDLSFRVVGYASYADAREDWVREPPPPGVVPNPVRVVDLVPDLSPDQLELLARQLGRPIVAGEPLFRFTMLPREPAHRVRTNQLMGLEYTVGMSDERFGVLATALPEGAAHALVVTVPSADPGGEPFQAVLNARPAESFVLGDTGFSLTIEQLAPQPPFPIITPGYENATSSVAIIHVETPDGRVFDRWLYSRFPELDQDIAKNQTEADGRPARSDADTGLLEMTYLDASMLQVLFDERPDGTVRSILRQPAGPARVVESLNGLRLRNILEGADAATGGGLDLVVSDRWEHARRFMRPVPTPEVDRDNQFVGTHARAMLAVEVGTLTGAWGPTVVWLGFNKYVGVIPEGVETVSLPDGRSVQLAFGRLRRPFPGFQARMLDFEMIAYDHRGAPRDYQSIIRVEPRLQTTEFEPYTHTVKLNAPLRAPFHWDPDASGIANTLERLARGFDPSQFKLSQAGWDQQGWQESQKLADQGVIDRPRAQFTILAVGNNPGIHIVALGSVMMAVGIPWAFYVKPWLVRREKKRLQKAHARVSAKATPAREPAPVPEEVSA